MTRCSDGMATKVPSHRRVLVTLFALSLTMLPLAASADIDGADYGVRPAPVGDGSRPIDRFEHAVEPGTSITDAVQVFNFGGETSVFDLYPADMVPSSNGGLAPATRESEIVSEGSWLTVDVETIELGPGESATVGFAIDVPLDASVGEHEAVMLVERRESPGEGAIDVRTRVGLRVGIEVLNEIDLAADLGSLGWDRAKRAFHLPLSNTGDVTFAVSGAVHVTDDDGHEIAAVTLLPEGRHVAAGEDATLDAVWEDPPLFGRFQAEAVVAVVVGDRTPVLIQSETISLLLVPWTLIVTVIGLIFSLVWALSLLRPHWKTRGRHRREEKAMLRDFRRRRAIEERVGAR